MPGAHTEVAPCGSPGSIHLLPPRLQADLLLVMGSSLVVHPFASLIGERVCAPWCFLRAFSTPLPAASDALQPACCGQGRSSAICSVCVSFRYPDKFDKVCAPAADEVGESTPRLLVNRERVGEGHPLLRLLGYQTGGFCFDEGSNYRCELRQTSCPWLHVFMLDANMCKLYS